MSNGAGMQPPPHPARGPDQVDVAICGGGPTGLALAGLLGRLGLSVALFERRASTTTLPKGQYLHASTGELFRQWGVWQRLEKSGWTIARSNGQGFYVNIAGGPVAEVRQSAGTDFDYIRKWERLSPAWPRKVPASDYEAALCRHAETWPGVSLDFSTRVVEVADHGDAVELRVRQVDTGAERTVACRYLVACDGAHSFIRSRLGQGEDQGPTFGNQVLVEFRADLEDTLGEDGFFHSFVLDPRYSGWFGSQHPQTGLWRYSFGHDEDELPEEDVVRERIRGALGMPGIALEIVQFYRFDYTTGLLRNWREGNVFFAGDAAHWHSPWGGFGMNSGIQDANNLAWKLALVLRGAATDGLLDTYQTERKTRALLTVKSATFNSLNFRSIVTSALLGEDQIFRGEPLSEVALTFLRQRSQPHGGSSVLHNGYQFGTAYQSRAVIADHWPQPVMVPDLAEYTETTLPGVRAPHVWLRDRDDRKLSLVDLWGPGFALVVQDRAPARIAAWRAAVEQTVAAFDVPLRLLHVGEHAPYVPDDDKFAKLYGADPGDAFLVRPDGFIARRISRTLSDDCAACLADSFERILGHPVHSLMTTGTLS